MTKKDLQQYKNLTIEASKLSKRIKRKERQLEEVATVKIKVQSSMKEFPYTPTHETVDAAEPRRYTAILKDLAELEKRQARIEETLLELDRFINSIDDSRTRSIIEERYAEGYQLKEVAAHFNMTEQGILKIINKILDEFNTV